ncbi:MAG: hypothetical protein J5I90_04190 [Caldilineales bacterium]|nr:hypothetical protein [Caldilineales bacterium]
MQMPREGWITLALVLALGVVLAVRHIIRGYRRWKNPEGFAPTPFASSRWQSLTLDRLGMQRLGVEPDKESDDRRTVAAAGFREILQGVTMIVFMIGVLFILLYNR